MNDILSTVGVCMSDREEPIQSSEVQDSQLIKRVQAINTLGNLLSQADRNLRIGSEVWILSLMSRLQVSNDLNPGFTFQSDGI